MRSRRSANEQVAEVARRRLELLSAELAELRPDPVDTPVPPGRAGGSGELPERRAARRHRSRRGPAAGRRPARPPAGRPAASAGRLARTTGCPPTLQGRVGLDLGAPAPCWRSWSPAALAVTAWWVAAGGRTARRPCRRVSATPAAARRRRRRRPSPRGRDAAPAAAAAGSAAAIAERERRGRRRRQGPPTGDRHPAARLPGGRRAGGRRRRPAGGATSARSTWPGCWPTASRSSSGVPPPPGVAASAAGAPGAGPGRRDRADGQPQQRDPGRARAAARRRTGDRPVDPGLPQRERRRSPSVDELLEVSGIGDATLAKIAPYVTL